MLIAFDVDGTLIHQIGDKEDTPRYEMIWLFKLFQKYGHDIIIWSGSGVDYAKRWAEKLGLEAQVLAKGSVVPDVVIDDEDTSLGTVDLRFPVLNLGRED